MEITAGRVVTILTILGFIVGAVFAAEDRYVSEQENIQSMQQMQQYYDGKLDYVQHDYLKDKQREIERKLQSDPNNIMLRHDLGRVQDKLNAIDQRMMTR